MVSTNGQAAPRRRPHLLVRIWRNLLQYPTLYIMIIPVLIWFGVFCYAPMYGVIIAFKK